MTRFADVAKTLELVDERGRAQHFPRRSDYVQLLMSKGTIADAAEFRTRPDLIKEVYFDWLRRGQVGCVFAQLFARTRNRVLVSTEVLLGNGTTSGDAAQLATAVNGAVEGAIAAPGCEGLTILLPGVESVEALVRLIDSLRSLDGWRLELPMSWRKTQVKLALRAQVSDIAWAEVLGMGPFPSSLPPTRQCPITSLEIRAKPAPGRRSKLYPEETALHLADLRIEGMSAEKFGRLSKYCTPRLRLRMLGGRSDGRAKAAVTFTVPSAIWYGISRTRGDFR